MELELIPFPISIIFVAVFAVAAVVVLWKLRKRGILYYNLFVASVIVGVFVVFVSIVASVLG